MAASSIALTGSNQSLDVGAAFYYGFTVRETSGTATATVRIYDNTSAAGTILETIQLLANESAREFYPTGIRVKSGAYVSIVSGAVEGSVRIG